MFSSKLICIPVGTVSGIAYNAQTKGSQIMAVERVIHRFIQAVFDITYLG